MAQAWILPALFSAGLCVSSSCPFCPPAHALPSDTCGPSVCLPSHSPALPKPPAEPSCLFPFAGHSQEELRLPIWLFLLPGLLLHVCQEDPGLP